MQLWPAVWQYRIHSADAGWAMHRGEFRSLESSSASSPSSSWFPWWSVLPTAQPPHTAPLLVILLLRPTAATTTTSAGLATDQEYITAVRPTLIVAVIILTTAIATTTKFTEVERMRDDSAEPKASKGTPMTTQNASQKSSGDKNKQVGRKKLK